MSNSEESHNELNNENVIDELDDFIDILPDDDFGWIPWFSDDYVSDLPKLSSIKEYLTYTPQDIKAELEKVVVNQESACKQVAIMMYQHLHGHRFVSILAGPTGSGKSFIAERLREMFPYVVYLRDVSNVTNEGWKGYKKVNTLFENIRTDKLYADTGIILNPLLFLDECDKLFEPRFDANGANVSFGVQSEFLTVIQGTEISVKDESGSHIVDTSKYSFLFAGAFETAARENAKKESDSNFGFDANGVPFKAYHRNFTKKDIIAAGCRPELAGRIRSVISLKPFNEKDFRRMLSLKNRGPVYELEKEFGLSINITESKKDNLAYDACVSGEGIRGMKNEIQKYIDELIWNDCHATELEIE